MNRPDWIRLAPAALACPAAFAQAPVYVLDDDPGPGVHYTSLKTALSEAPEGAVLVVKPGTYETATRSGKSLTMVGEPSGEALVDGRLRIENLAPEQAVVVRGLRVEEVDGISPTWIELSSNAGVVVLQDCKVRSGKHHTQPSVGIYNCDAVTLVGCDVLSGQVEPYGTMEAVKATNSHVTIYDSSCVGDTGLAEHAWGGSAIPGQGGHGVVLDGGTLFASGSILQGGAGSPGFTYYDLWGLPLCVGGGAGGHGILLKAGNPQVFLLDNLVAGGPGGSGVGTIALCGPGPSASAVSGAGAVTSYLGQARSLGPLPPLTPGETATLTFSGKPGDAVFLAASLAPGYDLMPELLGTFVLGTPFVVQPVGVMPAGGVLLVPLLVPPLLFPQQSMAFFLQGGFVNTGGAFFLGSPRTANILKIPL